VWGGREGERGGKARGECTYGHEEKVEAHSLSSLFILQFILSPPSPSLVLSLK